MTSTVLPNPLQRPPVQKAWEAPLIWPRRWPSSEERPSLVLAAGDMIQGHNWANLFQGESVIRLMNRMNFTAMVVGNHEFDFGLEVLKKRISEARFPLLGANVEGLPQLKPYVIKDLAGIRVAIIGVVTSDTPLSTHPRNVQGLKFLSPVDTVSHYLKALKGRADLFLVLTHQGFQADRLLAEKVKGIDVIVGGHSHTKIPQPEVVGQTIIVQACEHGKALGVLDLTVDDGKIVKFDGYLKEIKATDAPPDKKIQKIVDRYNRRLASFINETVGETAVDLDGKNVKTRETNLGNLVADIARQTTGAEVAIINGGSIKTGMPKGKVKAKDVYAALPFDNYLVALKLTGRQLKETLEHAVSRVAQRAGRFPQVSGLTFTYNPQAPAGARVKEVTIRGAPLVLEKEYLVATNDFLAAGGDGFTAFGEAIRRGGDYSDLGSTVASKTLTYRDPGRWLRDLVIDYFKTHPKVSPQVEGRIRELE